MPSNKLFYPSGALYADIGPEERSYYYENGTLKTDEPYFEGKLHGTARLYWPNGQMKRECQFERGVREGWDRMWSEEGLLVDEGRYEKGKPAGLHRRWTPQGDLIEEIEYIDPARCNFRQWDELGQLRFEGKWTGDSYFEKTWDRTQKAWKEKEGRWDGKKLVYL